MRITKEEAEHYKALLDSHNVPCKMYTIRAKGSFPEHYALSVDGVYCTGVATVKQCIHSLNKISNLGIKP